LDRAKYAVLFGHFSDLKRTETKFQPVEVSNKKQQLEIDFEPGLVERFPEFMDCLRASVYGCRKQFKSVAADLDMSASELSRKLADNPNDNVHYPAKRLAHLIESTGDLSPIYWLIEKFCEDADEKQRRSLEVLAQLARDLPQILKNAGVREPRK
jgi:hypothetical protein